MQRGFAVRTQEHWPGRFYQLAIFTRDLFATPNDEANRAAVAAVSEDALDLVGIAVRGPRKTVDKILDKLRPLA